MTPEDEWIIGKFLILYPLGFYLSGMLLVDLASRAWRAYRGQKAGFLA